MPARLYRNQPGYGMGPGGVCICLNCGAKIEHSRGIPCFNMSCPDCGSPMIREDLVSKFQTRFNYEID